MSQKALENTNEMCSCPLGILHWYNTPYTELIQYGRCIGKKVYWSRAMFDKSTDHTNDMIVAQCVFVFVGLSLCNFLRNFNRNRRLKLSMVL